jgi:ribosomal protein L3 glutamine methyltransferase
MKQASGQRRISTPPRTVGDLIRYGAMRFKARHLAFGHGLIDAVDEAAYLALHALGLPPDKLEPHLDLQPSPRHRKKILALFDRRIRERRPAAYLTGEAWLGDFRFRIDERAIVPRSYIAELLQQDLAPWIARPAKIAAALDLCTGSGCLAVMLAHSFPRARIDAADISSDALKVARRNVSEYRLQDRIRLVRSDLFAALAGRRYDLIISNPPYVTNAAMRRLPREYRHEPPLALAGGRDGLEVTRAILRDAGAHLNPGGLLVVEIGRNRARAERAFPRTPFIWPDTSGGNDCVFLVYREQLPEFTPPAV